MKLTSRSLNNITLRLYRIFLNTLHYDYKRAKISFCAMISVSGRHTKRSNWNKAAFHSFSELTSDRAIGY